MNNNKIFEKQISNAIVFADRVSIPGNITAIDTDKVEYTTYSNIKWVISNDLISHILQRSY